MVYHANAVNAPNGTFNDITGMQYNDITNNFTNTGPDPDLNILREASASGAAYNSPGRQPVPRCLEGTRKGVLTEILDWIVNRDGHPIFYLDGCAGTGKSAIARSTAELCEKEGWPIASFFFSLEIEKCNDDSCFFITIAHQLASIPALRSPILEALHENPFLTRQPFQSQFHKLIINPLSQVKIPLPSPIIVVIDSLHECKNLAMELLLSIGEALPHFRPHLRFFITNRPDPRVRAAFRKISHHVSFLSLHDFNPDNDIRLFLRSQLDGIKVSSREMTWPSETDVETLVKSASGLFLYAFIITKFIIHGGYPRQQLTIALDPKHASMASLYADLDLFYMRVLSGMTPTFGNDRVQLVVGTAILLFEPLGLDDLDDLLQLESGDAFWTLKELHSVFVFCDLDEEHARKPVGLVHTQFRNFLINKQRSNIYFINAAFHHGRIAHFCLGLISEKLKNASNIGHGNDIADAHLQTGRAESTDDALSYACRNWALHLKEAAFCESLVSDLGTFASGSLVLWIETVSLQCSSDTVLLALRAALQWLKKSNYAPAILTQQFREAEKRLDCYPRSEPYCRVMRVAQAEADIPQDELVCLYCRQKDKLEEFDFCGWVCANQAENQCNQILEVPTNHVVFKSVVEKLQNSWSDSGSAPSVQKLYKIRSKPQEFGPWVTLEFRKDIAKTFIHQNWAFMWLSGVKRVCNIGDPGNDNAQICLSKQCQLCTFIRDGLTCPLGFELSPSRVWTLSWSWKPMVLSRISLGTHFGSKIHLKSLDESFLVIVEDPAI